MAIAQKHIIIRNTDIMENTPLSLAASQEH